jgi:phosphoribosylformimino-5-aminoimidazole carboxamide ribotide isomerase
MDESTIFSDDPVATAARWAGDGARRLHIVDLNGAFAGEPVNGGAIEAIARAHPDLPIQIGGGIRDLPTIERYLAAGVSYVIIGTQAVRQPAFVNVACREFPGKVIVGIDAKDGMVATDGWAEVSDVSAVEVAKRFADAGVEAVVYTDIARDGMMQGLNIESTVALAQQARVPVIASGGVSHIDDIRKLMHFAREGVVGAITGRAIYEGTLDFAAAQTMIDEFLSYD